MSDQWYLTRDGKEYGPYSVDHVLRLAELGRLQPTDLVRKEGMTAGVPASQIKRLYPDAVAAVDSPPDGPAGPTAVASATATVATGSPETLTHRPNTAEEHLPPAEDVPPASSPTDSAGPMLPAEPSPASGNRLLSASKAPPSSASQPKKHLRRAVAVSGAIIMGQDGTTVKFRKKCTKCGYEDSARSTLIIGVGQMRTQFFCRKCRKQREVTLQGMG